MSTEQTIKPIETEYNGYRFRSRLEARWAVFFDSGNIKYEYETEGYETEDSEKYLPDFYLPELDAHVEVKGKRPGYEEEICRLPQFITWGGPIKQLVILSDIPGKTEDGGIWHFPMYYFSVDYASLGLYVNAGWFFFFDDNDNHISGHRSKAGYSKPHIPYGLVHLGFSINPVSDEVLCSKWRRLCSHETDGDRYCREHNIKIPYSWEHNKLTADSLIKARQARFDYGEKG